MAKRKSSDGDELNLDSLMDAVTNVVGVLMMVFVVMALSLADSLQRILSELPPVTLDEYKAMQDELAQIPLPPDSVESLEQKIVIAEENLKKSSAQLRSVDTSQQAVFLDLESHRKKLEDAKIEREKERVETDKLLTEVNRLKALLDETPEYKPEAATVVRLPNPRPFPENAKEMRILVAKGGVIAFDEPGFIDPILAGLKQIENQLKYDNPKPDPFVKLLTAVIGSGAAASKAWPDIAPLAGHFQIEDVAVAWKAMSDAGLPANSSSLMSLGDVSLAVRKNLGLVGQAVAALAKGDTSKWIALDPSNDPLKPTIKAEAKGGNLAMTFQGKVEEIKANPKDVMKYVDDLAKRDNIKNKARDLVIYDAYKIQEALNRAAATPALTKVFNFVTEIRPGQTQVSLKLTPASGGGESIEQIQRPESNFQRMLKAMALQKDGIAVFQVMTDAFLTYLQARQIADATGAPGAWETLASLDLTLPVRSYTVQRFEKVPPPPPPNPNGVRIKAPTRKVD